MISGPSFDDIVTHLAPAAPEVVAWLALHRGLFPAPGHPLPLEQLLNFGCVTDIGSMSDAAYEQLDENLEDGLIWALASWVRSRDRAGERVAAAVELAAAWWLPVLRAHDGRNAADVAELLRTAPHLRPDELRAVLATGAGLPPGKPPPSAVGHFCGAVSHWLGALLDPTNSDELARALDFATVAPDGSRRAVEIAAAVGR